MRVTQCLLSEETYGDELYKVFPHCAPGEVGLWRGLPSLLPRALTYSRS